MKKKNVFVCGILAAAMLTALAFTACEQPTDTGNSNNSGGNPVTPSGTSGKLTVNNLPSGTTYAVYVFASGTDISTFTAITNAYSSSNFQAVGASPSGNVFDLFGWNGGTASTTAWAGSGSLPVLLLNSSGNISETANPMYSWTTITITSGNGTANFNSFTAVVYGGGGPIGPVDPNDPKGKLTINNFPSEASFAITVYNYDEEITCLLDISSAQANPVALVVGFASSSPVSLKKYSSYLNSFDGTGTYLVLMVQGLSTILYADQVEFTDGCAELDFDDFGLATDLPTIAGGTGEPISNIDDIGTYLSKQKGGSTADKAINLVIDLELSEENWTAILNAISTAGKFVNIDLSDCTGSGSGGGLRSDGTFDPNKDLSNGKDKIASIQLPKTTKSIIDEAFRGITSLARVDIPDSVQNIGNFAFWGCTSLNSVTILSGVTSIGDGAFWGTSIASITIPNIRKTARFT